MDLSDDEVPQRAEADRREVDPPMQVEVATWSKLGSWIGGGGNGGNGGGRVSRWRRVGPTGLVSVLGRYLVAEPQAGRVAGDVDTDAIAFLLACALHNLLIAGPAWPHPKQRELKRTLAGIAAAIAAQPSPM